MRVTNANYVDPISIWEFRIGPSSPSQNRASQSELGVTNAIIFESRYENPVMTALDDPVRNLAGVGDKRAELLAALGISTIQDLLLHFPRKYEDRSRLARICDVKEGDTVTISAEIVKTRAIRIRRGVSLAEATLRDDTGEIKATWFGRDYLARAFPRGTRGFFSGVVGAYKGLALKNPEYELMNGDDDDYLHTGRIVPLYPLTEGLSQRMLRGLVALALDYLTDWPNAILPPELEAARGFASAFECVRAVHFPDNLEQARAARNRFAYEELLGIQIGVLRERAARKHERSGIRHVVDGPHIESLRRTFPFELTGAQKRVLADVLEDMAAPRAMLRLLQGDVGCGKTLIAMLAIAAACDGGYQAALMAPTEILADQHWAVLHSALGPLGIRVALLTGATSRSTVHEAIACGDVDVVVGTHALIQKSVRFHRLGLAVVDEQHRFGVLQRAALTGEGHPADVLHMTATPIPRTLAITVYGGMDISVIDEMPPGRTPIATRRVPETKVAGLHRYICEQAAAGFQTYMLCPLVEDSDRKQLTSVTRHYQELAEGPFRGLRTALLHGRMRPEEKEAVMQAFKRCEIDVLFSTTVIEVGIDCPNATTMVIEDASQFGLTQLHQLRGRVGRGGQASSCFLMGKPKTAEGRERLKIMCETTDGFAIAEADLAMRGPGELLGVRQAGLDDLHVADLIRDARLLDQARRDAQEILDRDPRLEQELHAGLRATADRLQRLNA